MTLRIYRGTHEIGGSCIEVTSGKSRIVLDIGMPLVDSEGESLYTPGGQESSKMEKHSILPDIPGLYPWSGGSVPDGVLVSHSHGDHSGLYPYLRPNIPLFMGEATRDLLNLTADFTGKPHISTCTIIKAERPFSCGAFIVTPFLMDHSAFDAYGFSIRAEGKTLIYTGDFRRHGRKKKAYAYFLANAPRQADILLIEGTMLTREYRPSKTESQLEEDFVQMFQTAQGIQMVCASSQNIDRIVTLFRSAKRAGKTLVVDFFTACGLEVAAKRTRVPLPSPNFPELRVFYPWRLTHRMFCEGKGHYPKRWATYKISREEINAHAQDTVLLMRASMQDDLSHLDLSGGRLLFSMWEGYTKEPKYAALLRFAREQGLEVLSMHTGGHADSATLSQTIKVLDPQRVIPVHTFAPDAFRSLSDRVTVLQDREPFDI